MGIQPAVGLTGFKTCTVRSLCKLCKPLRAPDLPGGLPIEPRPRRSPSRTGRGGAAAPDAFTWARSRAFQRSSLTGSSSGGSGAELAFWPLPEGLGCGETLTLELRGDPAGIVSDSQVGGAVLPLGPLAERYPSLLAGEAVRLQLALTSPQEQRAAAAAAAAAADASSIGGASGNATYATTAAPSGSSSFDEAAGAGNDGGAAGIRAVSSALQHGGQHDGQRDLEDAGSEGDDDGSPAWGSSAGLAAAADASLAAVLAVQAADGSSLAPPGSATAGAAGAAQGPALDLELRLEPVSCLDALLAVGLPAAAAQTCLAMLAEPGGLYLDVKSAYSTPQDLMVGLHAVGLTCTDGRREEDASAIERGGAHAPVEGRRRACVGRASVAGAAQVRFLPNVPVTAPPNHHPQPPHPADVCERSQRAGHPHQGGLQLPGQTAPGAAWAPAGQLPSSCWAAAGPGWAWAAWAAAVQLLREEVGRPGGILCEPRGQLKSAAPVMDLVPRPYQAG